MGNKIPTQSANMGLISTFLFLCAGLSGCATIHSRSISNYTRPPKTPAVAVASEDVGNGYFMLSLPKLDSGAKLRTLCHGRLTGIETTLQSRNWFFLVQVYEERSEAWCLGD